MYWKKEKKLVTDVKDFNSTNIQNLVDIKDFDQNNDSSNYFVNLALNSTTNISEKTFFLIPNNDVLIKFFNSKINKDNWLNFFN